MNTIRNIDYDDDNHDDNENDNNSSVCETVTIGTPILLVSNTIHPNNKCTDFVNDDDVDDDDDVDNDDGVLVRSLDHNFDNEQIFHLSAKQLQYDNIDITIIRQPKIASSNNNNDNNNIIHNKERQKADVNEDSMADDDEDEDNMGQIIIPGECDTNSFLVEEESIPKEIGVTSSLEQKDEDEFTVNSENVTGSILDELSQILKQHKSNGSGGTTGGSCSGRNNTNDKNNNWMNTVDDSSTVSSTIRATRTNVKEIKVECTNTSTSYIIQEVVSTCIEQQQQQQQTFPSNKDNSKDTSKGFLFYTFVFILLMVCAVASVYFGFAFYQQSQIVQRSLDSGMLNVLNDLLQNQSDHHHSYNHVYNKSTPSHKNNYNHNTTRYNNNYYNKGEGHNLYLFVFGCIIFFIMKLMVKGNANDTTMKETQSNSLMTRETEDVLDDERQMMVKPEAVASTTRAYTTPSKSTSTCYDNLVVLHSSCQKTLSRSGKASRKKKQSSSSLLLSNGKDKEQSSLFENLNLQSYDKLCKEDLITILHWFVQENKDVISIDASTSTGTNSSEQKRKQRQQQYKVSDMKIKLIYDLLQVYYNALYGLSKDELLCLLQYSNGGTKFIGMSLTKSMLITILLERGF